MRNVRRIIISDRYPAYHFLPNACHQVCWAHLKRDFQKISERPGVAGVVGRRLLHHYGKIFAFWKSSLQKGYHDDKHTQKKRRRLKNGLIKNLQFGSRCSHLTTARTCCNILETGEGTHLPTTKQGCAFLVAKFSYPVFYWKRITDFCLKIDIG